MKALLAVGVTVLSFATMAAVCAAMVRSYVGVTSRAYRLSRRVFEAAMGSLVAGLFVLLLVLVWAVWAMVAA